VKRCPVTPRECRCPVPESTWLAVYNQLGIRNFKRTRRRQPYRNRAAPDRRKSAESNRRRDAERPPMALESDATPEVESAFFESRRIDAESEGRFRVQPVTDRADAQRAVRRQARRFGVAEDTRAAQRA